MKKRQLLVLGMVVLLLGGCGNEETMTPEERPVEAKEEPKKAPPEPITKEFDWNKVFASYNLTDGQINNIKEILTTVGFTELELLSNNYEDCSKWLCAFRSKVYDSDSLQLNFTLENGKLFYAALTGVPNLTKKVGSTSEIILYHDIEGGYVNIYDHDENKIDSYEY